MFLSVQLSMIYSVLLCLLYLPLTSPTTTSIFTTSNSLPSSLSIYGPTNHPLRGIFIVEVVADDDARATPANIVPKSAMVTARGNQKKTSRNLYQRWPRSSEENLPDDDDDATYASNRRQSESDESLEDFQGRRSLRTRELNFDDHPNHSASGSESQEVIQNVRSNDHPNHSASGSESMEYIGKPSNAMNVKEEEKKQTVIDLKPAVSDVTKEATVESIVLDSAVEKILQVGALFYLDPIHELHLLPDNETRQYLLSKMNPVSTLFWTKSTIHDALTTQFVTIALENDSTNKVTVKTFQTIKDTPENNPDNIVLKHMILFENIQGNRNLFKIIVKLSTCFNPSLARLHGHYIVACRSNGDLGGSITLGWLSDDWKVMPALSAFSSRRLLGDENTHEEDDVYRRHLDTTNGIVNIESTKDFHSFNLGGEDFRLFPINYHELLLSYVFYTHEHNNQVHAQIRATKVFIGSESNSTSNSVMGSNSGELQVSALQYHLHGNKEEMLKAHQKNWCPFLTEDNHIYFMHSLTPMTSFHYNVLDKDLLVSAAIGTDNSSSRNSTGRKTLSSNYNLRGTVINHNDVTNDIRSSSSDKGDYRHLSLSNSDDKNRNNNIVHNNNDVFHHHGKSHLEQHHLVTKESKPSDEFVGPLQEVIWDYGMIKGGTPAIRISNDSYFAFFHSKEFLHPNFQASYVFGAYTFSSKPPYELQSFSRVPLVHRQFYDGPWSKYRNMIDYIVFPMSFVIKGQDHHNFKYQECDGKECWQKVTLLLSLGWQDILGYIVEVNLYDVLKTLVPV